MQITARDVAKLRKQTGAGMMDCKKALEQAEGDFDTAVEIIKQLFKPNPIKDRINKSIEIENFLRPKMDKHQSIDLQELVGKLHELCALTSHDKTLGSTMRMLFQK